MFVDGCQIQKATKSKSKAAVFIPPDHWSVIGHPTGAAATAAAAAAAAATPAIFD